MLMKSLAVILHLVQVSVINRINIQMAFAPMCTTWYLMFVVILCLSNNFSSTDDANCIFFVHLLEHLFDRKSYHEILFFSSKLLKIDCIEYHKGGNDVGNAKELMCVTEGLKF